MHTWFLKIQTIQKGIWWQNIKPLSPLLARDSIEKMGRDFFKGTP